MAVRTYVYLLKLEGWKPARRRTARHRCQSQTSVQLAFLDALVASVSSVPFRVSIKGGRCWLLPRKRGGEPRIAERCRQDGVQVRPRMRCTLAAFMLTALADTQ